MASDKNGTTFEIYFPITRDDATETLKLGAGQYIKKPVMLEKIGLAAKEELEK